MSRRRATTTRPAAVVSAAGRPAPSAMRMVLVGCFLSTFALFPSVTNAASAGRAILGVDLGSLYVKVAVVQSGNPLEIVTNQHSKRKTEQYILFDKNAQNQRFYGADAAALLARKSSSTSTYMSALLGRSDTHPAVRVLSERHVPVLPVYNESRYGVDVPIAPNSISFTPEELVAMIFNHAVDITVSHVTQTSGNPPSSRPKDLVVTVPSFATEHERKAILDAASVANLNVLSLVEENTAAALHYAMDKNFERKDEDEPRNIFLFYNMGASSTQVSVVEFSSQAHKASKFSSTTTQVPCVTVLGKAWDVTLGGNAFDHVLVEMLADQVNHQWNHHAPKEEKDVRTNVRAVTKLRLQANKIKHVLSANTEIPVYMDSVVEGVNLQTHVTREQLEEKANADGDEAALLKRVAKPIEDALKAANLTVANLTAVELLGGGMRIPAVQSAIQKYLDEKMEEIAATAADNKDDKKKKKKDKKDSDAADSASSKLELGMHMNADESMALGAAFLGANVSTSFRVRHVGLVDCNPFGITVSLTKNIAPPPKPPVVVNDTDAKNNDTEKKTEKKSSGWFGGGGSKKDDDEEKKEEEGDKKEKEGESEANATAAAAEEEEEEDDDDEEEEEEWSKQAVIFKPNGKMGIKKTIAFTHDRDVHAALDYTPVDADKKGASLLPAGTPSTLTRYNITGITAFTKEMKKQKRNVTNPKPKISLSFELTPSGITQLIKAEAQMEEVYTVQIEVEDNSTDVEDDDDTNSTETSTNATAEDDNATAASTSDEDEEEEEKAKEPEADADAENATSAAASSAEETTDATNSTDGTNDTDATTNTTATDDKNKTADAAKKKKKKKKTKWVETEKKRTIRKSLKISSYHEGPIRPYSKELLEASKDKLIAMGRADKDRVLLEEARNKVESYIYYVKNQLADHGDEISEVSTEEQRDGALKLATDAEDWLYEDGYNADLATMLDKYAALSEPFEEILLRVKEVDARPAAVADANEKLTKFEATVKSWEEEKPHITAEERETVLGKLEEMRSWLTEMEGKQAKLKSHDKPVLLSADIQEKWTEADVLITAMGKKPKPKPKKEKKNTTKTTTKSANATNATNTTAEEDADEKKNETTTTSADADGDGDDKKEKPKRMMKKNNKKEEEKEDAKEKDEKEDDDKKEEEEEEEDKEL